MHKTLHFAVLLLLSTCLSAQSLTNFQDDVREGTCPYDSTQTGLYASNFQFFLTLDDTYDGVIDSSWCPVIRESGIRFRPYELDLTGFDFSRPLFFRIRYPENSRPAIEAYINHQLFTNLNYFHVRLSEEDCAGDCSQIYFRYQFRETGNTTFLPRSFEFDLSDSLLNFGNVNCFMSERFEEQELLEIGMRFHLAQTNTDPRLVPFQLQLEEEPFISLRPEVGAVEFEEDDWFNGRYVAYPLDVVIPIPRPGAEEDGFYHLGQYTDRLPGNDAIRYTEVQPAWNPDTAVSMTINFEEFANIAFPPFTGMRGAAVIGQDSLRHELILNFGDGYFGSCVQTLIDLPVPGNTVISFGNGEIGFGRDNACYVLEPGSELSIRPLKHFVYGYNGQGQLALKENSRLRVAEGATLTVANTFRLLILPDQAEAGAHLYLEPNSKLIFTPHAHVERKFPDANAWIYVHGTPDQIDFGGLTAEERALFKFIEPTVVLQRPPVDALKMSPNPLAGSRLLFVQLPTSVLREGLKYHIVDTNGREVASGVVNLFASSTEGSITLPATLPAGLYFVRTNDGRADYNGKLIVR